MEIRDSIRELAEKYLKDNSQFIVDVIVSLRRNPKKVLVILDGDQGATIDDCADLNRALSESLDKVNLIEGRYVLEVSTPGLDHPLQLKRQYYKNINRKVRVKTAASAVEGVLIAVTDESITIRQTSGNNKKKEIKEIIIPFTEIEKTFVLVSFN
ncbi:MAG: ribosome maturation factor RimP [Flammeovirgaceae bacterium]|nr:MAG: ribosome maturation factor RimP [Flammeovirgaceae bacterium]